MLKSHFRLTFVALQVSHHLVSASLGTIASFACRIEVSLGVVALATRGDFFIVRIFLAILIAIFEAILPHFLRFFHRFVALFTARP